MAQEEVILREAAEATQQEVVEVNQPSKLQVKQMVTAQVSLTSMSFHQLEEGAAEEEAILREAAEQEVVEAKQQEVAEVVTSMLGMNGQQSTSLQYLIQVRASRPRIS